MRVEWGSRKRWEFTRGSFDSDIIIRLIFIWIWWPPFRTNNFHMILFPLLLIFPFESSWWLNRNDVMTIPPMVMLIMMMEMRAKDVWRKAAMMSWGTKKVFPQRKELLPRDSFASIQTHHLFVPSDHHHHHPHHDSLSPSPSILSWSWVKSWVSHSISLSFFRFPLILFINANICESREESVKRTEWWKE